MKTTDVILKDLRANSSELITVQSFYVRFGHKIHTVFFHAEYEATLESGKRTLLASIAGDAKAETIALHSNHRDLVRFPSPESDDYKTVLYYLEDYANNASNEQLDKWFREENMRVAAKGGPIVQPVPAFKGLAKPSLRQSGGGPTTTLQTSPYSGYVT
ncbi:hypothetical protein PIIN_11893 [Serendipita indica DSM 11827]|uniref:Uncharacterized protein n=1 Tax=Serendipita indica (strain DSM 11827) TaxID=1109443 RepID=G4TXY1_SERID|nr:hypothetical protein PIIN_11893 [Serendipita indica DSM 11827]